MFFQDEQGDCNLVPVGGHCVVASRQLTVEANAFQKFSGKATVQSLTELTE